MLDQFSDNNNIYDENPFFNLNNNPNPNFGLPSPNSSRTSSFNELNSIEEGKDCNLLTAQIGPLRPGAQNNTFGRLLDQTNVNPEFFRKNQNIDNDPRQFIEERLQESLGNNADMFLRENRNDGNNITKIYG